MGENERERKERVKKGYGPVRDFFRSANVRYV